jgi:quinolinate synthase
MNHRLRKEAPGKMFYAVEAAICPNMRAITLENVRDSLLKSQHKVELSDEVIAKARAPLERMLEAGRQD